jgi:hypothetical protein
LLEEVKEQLKSTVIVEDKELLLALINGNIEKEEHKQKQGRMLELMVSKRRSPSCLLKILG